MKKIKIILSSKVKAFIDSKTRLIENKTTGVYFLKYNDTVVYVGQSKNIPYRIRQHLSEKSKVFSDFDYIRLSKNELNNVEKIYIENMKPIFNKTFMPKGEINLDSFCVENNIPFEYIENYEMGMKIKITTTINKKWVKFIEDYIASQKQEGQSFKINMVIEKGLSLLKKEFENDK